MSWWPRITYNSLISASLRQSQWSAAFRIWDAALHRGFVPGARSATGRRLVMDGRELSVAFRLRFPWSCGRFGQLDIGIQVDFKWNLSFSQLQVQRDRRVSSWASGFAASSSCRPWRGRPTTARAPAFCWRPAPWPWRRSRRVAQASIASCAWRSPKGAERSSVASAGAANGGRRQGSRCLRRPELDPSYFKKETEALLKVVPHKQFSFAKALSIKFSMKIGRSGSSMPSSRWDPKPI